tara:strand:+ start:508 stop:774 length:267 start_codon:yes stop_codon:yes gene_type:complete
MQTKVNLSDVLKVGVFIAGLLGTWYSMKYQVDYLSTKVEKLEKQLEETNLGVIQNDIDYIKKGQNELKNDLQQYYDVVNRYIANHSDE